MLNHTTALKHKKTVASQERLSRLALHTVQWRAGFFFYIKATRVSGFYIDKIY